MGAPLPDTVRAELKAAGWIDGPWARSEEELESALQLPIAVESWDAFDALYAWDERPLREGGDLVCTSYLGAAVRSFFARGGRRALIVRVGDPWPYLVADRAAQRRQRIRALVPSFADVAAPAALFDVNDPRKWRGIEHLYGSRRRKPRSAAGPRRRLRHRPAAAGRAARTAGAAGRLRRMQRGRAGAAR